jgi:feruloyl esterase
MWPLIVKDAVTQCDALDGYVDGIIEDPALCSYNPKDLACTATKTSQCLTAAQLESVRQIYSPLIQKDGSMIYPRLQPGSSGMMLASGQAFQITQDWFRYAIYNDPNWDPKKITLEDMAYASKLNPQNAETWDGDLGAFKNRGSKVIHYHGHEDQLISSANSARYYEHVRKTMKLEPDQLDSFYRYFQISGMAHCSGGSGAHMFGQGSAASINLDPESNVLMAIVRWVEQGVAPETILGTKFNGDNKTQGVKFQRRHCRYPRRNKYSGKGDAASAESWQCVL